MESHDSREKTSKVDQVSQSVSQSASTARTHGSRYWWFGVPVEVPSTGTSAAGATGVHTFTHTHTNTHTHTYRKP